MMFIDTHAHLTSPAYQEDREEVIKKSKECGIEFVITSGFNLPSSVEAFNLAKNSDGIFCSVGIYPENIYELNDEVENELFLLAQNREVVAIGEIGLQYTDNMPDKESQKAGFVRQLKLASKLNKPIVIHCRDAYGDMLELLKENKKYLACGGTMHCFNGSKEIAEELIKLGLYISVGGVSTFKNASKVKQTLSELPLDRLLLETDCPFLTPHPYRGERNSPAFIPTIAENLAQIKGVSTEEVALVTTANARRLFKI